ncbi:unnamed protein product [Orchesella dallaii]|uniref:Uncharacterized protein n=1 Tax=Orchesella dallaii TaxID=48710 RepID=A0ABP1PZY1_9HEXA
MKWRYVLCPCIPNCNSERVVKALAVIGAVFAGVYVGFWTTILVRDFRQSIPKNTLKFIFQELLIISFIIIFLLEVGLGFLLYNEARNRSQRTCKAWLALTGFIVVFAIVISVASLAGVGFKLDVIILICPWVAFKIYEWLTVLSYLEGLKGNEGGDVGVVFTNSESRLTETGQTHHHYIPSPIPQ